MRLRILLRDQFVCHWCGGRATSVDHLVPRALGGSDYDPRNLVASCGLCNSKRGGELARQIQGPRARRPSKSRRVWRGAIGGE